MQDAIRTGSWLTVERIRIYSWMLGIFGLAALLFIWSTGTTPLTDRFGRPIATDFSAFWTSGRMLLEGDTLGMFDPAHHFEYQSEIFGDPYIDHYGWHYPPFFLAVAALVALLPYVPALLVWQASTFAMFALTIRAILPKNPLVFAATFGFPACFLTFGHGHNAFLTSALLGTGLLLLERRPVVSGVLLGLLAYKPQFALVVPIVVLFGGHWRVAATAAATVAAMVVASTLILGPEVWTAFLRGAVFTREVVLEQGGTGWHKIQSVFSAMRSLGAPLGLAYGVQFTVTVGVMLSLVSMTLGNCDRYLIAAATAVATLLATPYCLDYDMTILGIAIAFMTARGLENGFAPYKKSLLALVWLTPLVARNLMDDTGVPVGALVMLLFYAFIVRIAFVQAGYKFPSLRSAVRG